MITTTNPFEELAFLIREVKEEQSQIKAEIEKLRLQDDNETLITREEKARQLDVSLPTLRNWELQGIIKPIRKGRRVYFLKCEEYPKVSTR